MSQMAAAVQTSKHRYISCYHLQVPSQTKRQAVALVSFYFMESVLQSTSQYCEPCFKLLLL